jgi:hypothetical protein
MPNLGAARDKNLTRSLGGGCSCLAAARKAQN